MFSVSFDTSRRKKKTYSFSISPVRSYKKERTGCLDLKALRGRLAGPSPEPQHLQSQRQARQDHSSCLLSASGDNSAHLVILILSGLSLCLSFNKQGSLVTFLIAEWVGLRKEVDSRAHQWVRHGQGWSGKTRGEITAPFMQVL